MMRNRMKTIPKEDRLPTKYPWLGLAVLIVLCFVVAGIGGLVTTPNIPNWYAGLVKPSWTPPDWVFGPVWSVSTCAWRWRLGWCGGKAMPSCH